MLKKENRLTKRKEFGYIFKKGKSFSTKTLILNYTPTKLDTFKTGFSVSKKIGNAVVRNKVKRRMREAFREISPLVSLNYNYILVAKPGIELTTFEEIKKSMLYALKKCDLLKNEKEAKNDSQNN